MNDRTVLKVEYAGDTLIKNILSERNRDMNKANIKFEWGIASLLFLFFFLVIGVFQILKPLKSGLFVAHYGAYLELYAKLANIFIAGLGVMAYTLLYNRLQRQHLLYLLSGFFLVGFVGLANMLENPGSLTVWGFYLLGDLEATIMVAAFWAYLTDITHPSQASRLFGTNRGGRSLGWMDRSDSGQTSPGNGWDRGAVGCCRNRHGPHHGSNRPGRESHSQFQGL